MTTGDGPRVVAVVQARTGSTRLPGKVLRPLGGRTVLEWVVRAAQEARGVDAVVVATTGLARDDAVEEAASRVGAAVVRGPEDDVLARFLLAVERTGADAVVRLTADCPLLDPALIAAVVAMWREDPATHYVSTTLHRTLPRGLDVELATADALRAAERGAQGVDRVHVTSALYADGSPFRRAGLVVAPDSSHLRVTLDEEDDARAIDAVVAELGDRAPSWREVVALLDARPDLVALNAGVRQKDLESG